MGCGRQPPGRLLYGHVLTQPGWPVSQEARDTQAAAYNLAQRSPRRMPREAAPAPSRTARPDARARPKEPSCPNLSSSAATRSSSKFPRAAWQPTDRSRECWASRGGRATSGTPCTRARAWQGGVPCHRVVFKDGMLAPGFAFGGPGAQRALLEAEGVGFLPDGRVRMAEYQWEA